MKNGAANVRFVPKADVDNIIMYYPTESRSQCITMQAHRNIMGICQGSVRVKMSEIPRPRQKRANTASGGCNQQMLW
jgi:hypothetical protein